MHYCHDDQFVGASFDQHSMASAQIQAQNQIIGKGHVAISMTNGSTTNGSFGDGSRERENDIAMLSRISKVVEIPTHSSSKLTTTSHI